MKTITLAEAQERATQGKLKAFKHRIRGAITNHSIACDVDYANAELIVHHWNTYTELVEALENLMAAHKTADKQWVGLNMNDAGQRRAYELIQEANIAAESALAHAKKVEVAE